MRKVLLGFVLACMSLAARAQLGDWVLVTKIAGMPIVSTSSGTSELGVFCLQGESCHPYLFIDGLCGGEALRIPVLVNANNGAVPLVASCRNLKNSWFLVLEDYDDMKMVLEAGGDAGFAIPLASGQFRVIRFSMRGASRALQEVQRLSSPGGTTSPRRSDQIL